MASVNMHAPTGPVADDEEATTSPLSWQALLRRTWLRAQGAWRTLFKPALVRLDGAGRVAVGAEPGLGRVHEQPPARADELALAFEAWCASHEGCRAEVWLPARSVWQAWMADVAQPEAATQQACEQWAHYFGQDAAEVQATMALRAAAVPGGTLVLAAPQTLIDDLSDVAVRHGVRLQGVSPWWLDAAQAWLASSGDATPSPPEAAHEVPAGPAENAGHAHLQLTEPGARLHVQAQRAAAPGQRPPAILTGLWLEPAADADASSDAGEGAHARNTVPQAQAKGAWPGLRAPRWRDELDFLGPRVRTSLVAWALLALGLVAVLHATDVLDASRQALDEAQADVRRLERAQHQARLSQQARQVSVKASMASRDGVPELDANGWRRAAEMAHGLGFDWLGAMDHIHATAAQEQVALTRLSLDLGAVQPGAGTSGAGTGPAWRMQAAVREDAQALQWLDSLGRGASLRSRDKLPTAVDTPGGSLAWRIEATFEQGARP